MAKGDVAAAAAGSAPGAGDGGEGAHAWVGEGVARHLDDMFASWAGSATEGLPAPRIGQAYLDWLVNLMLSPGRELQVAERFTRGCATIASSVLGRIPEIKDRRFSAPVWNRKPLAWLAVATRERDEVLKLACSPLPGMSRHHANMVSFYTEQILEAMSPTNVPFLNPDVWEATREQHGRNLLRGARNAWEDAVAKIRHEPADTGDFRVGQNLAATPGKVVYRNRLMELIQYTPITETVYAEPILIVPAWIMKYYILDLSPDNSLVRWLVTQGHTVFMISWKNPDSGDSELSMNDYRRLGVLEALDAVNAIVPRRKVHVAGYCVGGTLLSVTLAAMARDKDQRVKTATLFAAQTDFEDAGELKLFIDEMALYWLDQRMAKKGYLEASQMGSAFGMLRAHNLIWMPAIRHYWLGESDGSFDIMAWNADGTRMPRRMHSDYLRYFYLENRFAQGKYKIDGRSVSMGDVSLPMFVVGTTTDHVAPWKSVYKIRNLKRLGDTTLALTNGGHNAGIVSEPGRPRRRFHLGSWDADTPFQSPDEWLAGAELHEGSWWPAWQTWLVGYSGERVAPPSMGNKDKGYDVLCDAPGTYVFQK